MATPQHKNPYNGGHDIFNVCRPFHGYHYYILSLSDLCPWNYLPLGWGWCHETYNYLFPWPADATCSSYWTVYFGYHEISWWVRSSDYHVIPKINCSIRNLYQGFRKSRAILLLTNIVDSSDVGQFPCRYRWQSSFNSVRWDALI